MSREAGRVFVGRAFEIDTIRDRARRAFEGRTQFVAIEGPAGIGKSSLVHEAVAPLTDWRRRAVRLDQYDEARPASTTDRLFPDMPESGARDLDGLLRGFIALADAEPQPQLVIVEDLQWIDTLSGELLLRGLHAFDAYRLLVIVTFRAGGRELVDRLSHFAVSHPEATHLSLGPLSPTDTGAIVAARTGAPMSPRVAADIHAATDGYPLHAETVGQWLATAPVGERNLDDALEALLSGAGRHGRLFDQAIAETLTAAEDGVLAAVELLAVAERPLSAEQIDTALAGLADAAGDRRSVLATGLATWDSTTMRLAIRHRTVAESIVRSIAPKRRATLHGRLAEMLDPVSGLRHRVAALTLQPRSTLAPELIMDLHRAGGEAMARGEDVTAFRRFEWAARFDRTDRSVLFAALSALRGDKPGLVASLADRVEALPQGPTRAAVLALLALESNDVEAAYDRLESAEPRADDPEALLLFAHVTNAAARHGAVRGAFLRSAATLAAVQRALDELLAALRAAPADAADPRRTAGLIAEAASVSGILQMWRLLEHGDASRIQGLNDDLDRVLAWLAQIPGTDTAQRVIRTVRGSRRRQLGDHAAAYADLALALGRRGHRSRFDGYARVQLAVILFEAALWDEANEAVETAIGDLLAHTEEGTMLTADAVAALVPALRGEHEVAQAFLHRAHEGAELLQSPSVRAMVEYAKAWTAIGENDHAAASRHLAAIGENPVGWAMVGVPSIALLVRSLVFENDADRAAEARRRIDDDRIPAADGARSYARSHADAMLAIAAGDAESAYAHLMDAVRWLDAEPALRPALTSPEGGGLRLHRSILAIDLAELVVANERLLDTRRDEARRLAAWARGLFLQNGALTLQERAERVVAKLQHEPVVPESDEQEPSAAAQADRAYDALATLTTRERQIALLVVSGRTSREVAAELYLSVRTVEYHVGNALAKLQMRTRVELRRLLRPLQAAAAPDGPARDGSTVPSDARGGGLRG